MRGFNTTDMPSLWRELENRIILFISSLSVSFRRPFIIQKIQASIHDTGRMAWRPLWGVIHLMGRWLARIVCFPFILLFKFDLDGLLDKDYRFARLDNCVCAVSPDKELLYLTPIISWLLFNMVPGINLLIVDLSSDEVSYSSINFPHEDSHGWWQTRFFWPNLGQ